MLLYTHDAFFHHDTGPGHPEHAGRLAAVLDALSDESFQFLIRLAAPRATVEQLVRVHPRSFVDDVLGSIPQVGRRALDADTIVSPGSGEAALRAAGAVVAAVDAVIAGPDRRAFCAVRPPGHHAEAARAMGFCLFNSIAVGAAHALAVHSLQRVAVIDFDVHHGNGTQDIFQTEPRVLYASSHQAPLYPGTGRPNERGCGNICNAELAPGADSSAFREVWEALCRRIDDFAPELLLVSAGFDAHRLDPLADLNVETRDYEWLTRKLTALAHEHCRGRMVSALEGGYSLAALREASAAHVKAMM